MKPIKFLTLLFSFVFLLSACGGGSSSNGDSLKIGSVFTDIFHYHPSFFEKWGSTPVRTIRFTLSVSVSDPKGVNNLSELYIRDKATNRFWSMLGGPNDIAKEECYVPRYDIFECRFYSSLSLDKVNLKNWEVVAENQQGDVSRKDFEFLLPSGEPVEDEQFVYSSVYSGSIQNGVAALEALTIASNNIEFSSNAITQSFNISFASTDARAKHYALAFYDGTGGINSVGSAWVDSPSIQATPIIQGQKTSIDIPWSEVVLYDEYSVDDIDGLHIRLYDEPIEWLDDGIWFNYISYSEFITL